MNAVLAALALLLQSAQDLSGLYRTQQMEVGAALELNADGTFQYSLDYGAVSEAARGHWAATDGIVRLTSDPLPPGLMLEIERNDAGFDGETLAIDDGALVLQRHDTIFVFHRDEP
jgi:hypothetical protein